MSVTPGYVGEAGGGNAREIAGPLFALVTGRFTGVLTVSASYVYGGPAFFLVVSPSAIDAGDDVVVNITALNATGDSWLVDQWRTKYPAYQSPRTILVPPTQLVVTAVNNNVTPHGLTMSLTPQYGGGPPSPT